MPYVVLARRWRPQLFATVVGQEHVTKTLQNAISSNRIAHAYLFTGPRGVGKTTVARIFAKAVNCKEGPRPEPCNACNVCEEISAGRSMDVIEIDAASNRGIDEIRELRENVKFAPVLGRYKVYIIDEAHMLTIEAFNALLKTLEEPPGHVIFILATTEPHKIPATILSRCQRFDFRMLTRKEIMSRLRELVDADGFSADDEVLSLIAENADGALRDAESILDQMLSFSDGKLQAEEVSKFLGLGAYHLLDALVENIIKGDSVHALGSLDTLANHGADLSQCLKRLVSYFRDLVIYKINPGLIDASETKLQKLAEQAKSISVERLMKIVRVLTQTESDIKQLGYERLNLEMALVKLSMLKEDSVPLDRVLDKLEEIESRLSSDVIAKSIVNPEPIYAEASVEVKEESAVEHKDSDPLHTIWTNLLKAIKGKCPPTILALLKDAYPVAIEDGSLIIDFPPDLKWHREQLEEAENKGQIKQLSAELSKLMGKPASLKVRSISSPESSKIETPTLQKDIRLDAMQDETVQLVLKIFDGRIVEVKK